MNPNEFRGSCKKNLKMCFEKKTTQKMALPMKINLYQSNGFKTKTNKPLH